MARFLHTIRRLRAQLSFPRIAGAFWASCVVGVFCGCEEIEEEKPWIQVERPQMLFTDTTLLDSYNNNVLSWKLKTAYLERWADKEIVFVRPIFVDIYDSLGERAAFLRADSGRFDMKFTYVNAYGHVYALTPKGASVRADSLIWNKRDNLVRTESYVRVVSEDGDVLQGKGFESDAKMDNWKILADVTGIFQDAANRLKEEDKKQAAEHALPDSAAQAQPAQNSAQPVTQNATQPSQSSTQPAAAAEPAAAPASKAASSAQADPDTSTGRREMDPEADAEMLRQSRMSVLKHMRPALKKDSAQSAPAKPAHSEPAKTEPAKSAPAQSESKFQNSKPDSAKPAPQAAAPKSEGAKK